MKQFKNYFQGSELVDCRTLTIEDFSTETDSIDICKFVVNTGELETRWGLRILPEALTADDRQTTLVYLALAV